MMFSHDIVVCGRSTEQLEEILARWKFALDQKGKKVSGTKTE